ncbi:MAG: Lrp/AsnC family transcriptional regulator [Candidatus Aenigmarchaeota archaeon]|nr:Lrp/AsnC family transcriptional regulator [Candidatus Aenigmarchaeota archaeon]
MKLDIRDLKLMHMLVENSRYSNTRIGKTLNISKDAAAYRIRRLKRKGCIKSYETIINFFALGYRLYYLMVQLQPADLSEEDSFVQYISSYPNVITCLKASGKWDFQITYAAKDSKDIGRIIDDLSSQFNIRQHELFPQIAELKFTPLFSMIDLRLNVNDRKDSSYSTYLKDSRFELKDSKNVKLDRTDTCILKHLSSDPRASLADISKDTGLTAEAVSYRIKSLIRKDVILGFSILPDYLNLGYLMHTVFLDVSGDKYSTIRHFLDSENDIIHASQMDNDYNLVLYVLSKTHKDFNNLLIRTRRFLGERLKSYESTLILEWYCYNLFPECLCK